MSKDIKVALDNSADSCKICSELASRAKRFKLMVGNDDARLTHSVAADIMYRHSRSVLHVVDERTHFGAAVFLQNMSSKEVWKALRRCWIHLYIGPPHFF